ncbi:MAG: DEAD/DEAH box helicase, partial [Muribaculaceae bacterium]|nr:DEAD/DEAH box helicase [Muribaculaceae bacterium]
DEADRMLDMGFYDDIMRIARQLPTDRQTLMFSATMPAKTRKLAKEILRNPRRVDIAVSRPTDKIDQNVYLCRQGVKPALLLHILRNHCSKRVIVFAASKMAVKDLTRELRRRGIKAAEMHSDLDQNQREEALLGFRAGKIDVIVATDILARGIDIDDIAMVVNYDVPREVEDYVHRIGRTARADRDGIAVTIVGERDRQPLRRIEQFLGYEIKRCQLPEELASMAPAKEEQPRNHRPHGERPGDNRRGGRRGSGNQKRRGNANASANKDNHAQAGHNGNNHHNRRTNRSTQSSQKQ